MLVCRISKLCKGQNLVKAKISLPLTWNRHFQSYLRGCSCSILSQLANSHGIYDTGRHHML